MNSKYKQGAQADSMAPLQEHNPLIIQQALDEIFLSTPFRSTRQCKDLLRYIVDNTLAGLDQLLRERVIGAEVFGRKPDYDTGEDPVVRLRAAEVRKRLAQYYQGANGKTPVRIDIPSGSYRATFEWVTSQETDLPSPLPTLPEVSAIAEEETELSLAIPTETVSIPSTMDQSTTRPRLWRWLMFSGFVLALIALLLWWNTRNPSESAFRQFWSPMTGGSKPVVICMGSNAVYRLSNQYVLDYLAATHQESNGGFDFFPDIPPDQLIEAHNLQKAYNSFVALGDVAAVADVVADLTRQGTLFKQRFPPDISFAELQNTPTITIGGFNNPLTITLTKDLRFVLTEGSRIEDRQDPSKNWSIRSNGDSHDTEDYAVISRLIDAKTGGPVISIAGIGQYGTQAAAEFISSPEAIAGLVTSAPRGWVKRNIQIVLHIHIVNFRPITTKIISSYYW